MARYGEQERMMQRAIQLARRGMGRTTPNPAVGCVVVRDGHIVGEGWHRRAGEPHAEVYALASAGERACGADLYVTLEPCSHHGRTPPCAEAVARAGVARVFAGTVDPNPKNSGQGITFLRSQGIEVTVGLLERECRQVIEPFAKHVTSGMPFVILKSAVTLDGKTATAAGDSKWITSDSSRRYVHRIRAQVDAVMVGSGTVLRDDPLLTCRVPGGRDPLRVVVDSSLSTPLTAQVCNGTSPAGTIITTVTDNPEKVASLAARGIEVLHCQETNGRIDLGALLRQLGSRGVQSVLLEGGHTLAGEALRRGLIDKFLIFIAPCLVGGAGLDLFAGPGVARIAEAQRLIDLSVRRIGGDILITGYPERPCLPA